MTSTEQQSEILNNSRAAPKDAICVGLLKSSVTSITVIKNDLYGCYETNRTSNGFPIMLLTRNVSNERVCNLIGEIE